MIYNSPLEAIGNTPLIKLNKIVSEDMADIYVKHEAVNIGGSIKSRTAYNMIIDAEEKGILKKDSIIVECSSGNQGIALAMIGAVKGYEVIIVMPDSVSIERRKLIEQYGAKTILVEDKGDIAECIAKCQAIVEEYKNNSKVFVPAQFDNIANIKAQKITGKEIIKDLKQIDGFVSGIGTGGSLTGIGQVLREHNPNIIIWAIEPENAAILSGKPIGTHIQMGIGDGLIPSILDTNVYDDICIVTDKQALQTSKLLAKQEGLLVGISSGSNVTAAIKLAKQLGKGKNVVTVLPDTGERYYSTDLFK